MDKISEIDKYLKTLDLPTELEKWIYLEKLVEQGIINALNNQIKAEQIRNYFQLTCYFNYRLTKDYSELGCKLLATELTLGSKTDNLCYWLSSFALLQVPNLAIADRDLELLAQKCRYYVEEIRPKFHQVLSQLIDA
jgi:hypothetical protein